MKKCLIKMLGMKNNWKYSLDLIVEEKKSSEIFKLFINSRYQPDQVIITRSFRRQVSLFTRRLADLRTHWAKVQELHGKISLLVIVKNRKTLPYFLNDEFFATEDAYNDAADILREAVLFVKTVIPARDGRLFLSRRDESVLITTAAYYSAKVF